MRLVILAALIVSLAACKAPMAQPSLYQQCAADCAQLSMAPPTTDHELSLLDYTACPCVSYTGELENIWE